MSSYDSEPWKDAEFLCKNLKILAIFTQRDYGPLHEIPGGHYSNFGGGTYYLAIPKQTTTLYQRRGPADRYGQYWFLQPWEGNHGYYMNAPVPHHSNDMDRSDTLLVPSGVYMYVGKIPKKVHFAEDEWQVFIPQEIMDHLVKVQPEKLIQYGAHKTVIPDSLNEIYKLQENLIERYKNKQAQRLYHYALKSGSELRKLPPDVLKALQAGGRTTGKVQPGTYIIHRDSIPVVGRGRRNITVSAKLEADRSETHTFKSGYTTVTESINYFNIISEVKEA